MATLRQKKLVENLIKGVGKRGKLTATEELIAAGYSAKTARSKQKEMIERKGVQECLRAAGITHDRLAKKFSRLIDAKKVVYVETDDEGNRERIEEDDTRIQLDTAKFCAVMTKMSDTDGETGNGGTSIVNIYIPEKSKE